MAKHEDWELQLAPLVSTSDLLDVFDIEGSVLAGVKLRSGAQVPVSRGKSESVTQAAVEASYIDVASRKGAKEHIEVRSYPMDAIGARKCLREAVILRRTALCAEPPLPQFRRGLSHLITPLGIWTTEKTSFLHVRQRSYTTFDALLRYSSTKKSLLALDFDTSPPRTFPRAFCAPTSLLLAPFCAYPFAALVYYAFRSLCLAEK